MNCVYCQSCPFDQRDPFWQEKGIRNPLRQEKGIYELHVTVRGRVKAFVKTCASLGIKPLVIQKQLKSEVEEEVMTSQRFEGCDTSAMTTLNSTVHLLTRAGFEVIRKKIETAPWHPDAPSVRNSKWFLHGQYFESHVGVWLLEGQVLPEIDEVRWSRNALKETDHGTLVMGTFRSAAYCREEFEHRLDCVKSRLLADGFKIDRTIVEFSLYDSCMAQDENWMRMMAS